MLALALESVLFLLINFVIEIVYDQDLPSDNESSSENILEIRNATKYYKNFLSDPFLAVDGLRRGLSEMKLFVYIVLSV